MTEVSPDWLTYDPKQAKVLGLFMDAMTSGWVWLYREEGEAGVIPGHSYGMYSALLSPERVDRALGDASWEVMVGSGGPGFSTYYEDGERRTVYERPDGDIEILVLYREYHGVRPTELEIAEEFRILFNLWEDRPTRTYYYFDGSGNPVKAAVIDAAGVRVLASLVRRYAAAKQLYVALYLDSTLWSAELPEEHDSWDHADATTVLAYYTGDAMLMSDGHRFSRLLGKRLFAPAAVDTCEIPPFDRQTEYEDFLVHFRGEEIRFTSNPAELANYFGANPDNPHYLTPVYFRRDVLNKYYANPDLFSVEDGYLRCAGLWGLRLDNDQPGHVMVFLGDLGRDIPHEEAVYWRSHNISAPEEGPSETLVRRAFGNQPATPKSVDLLFPRAYRKANEAWTEAFGARLFKPLHEDDRHILRVLHIPIGDTAAEFDQQVLYLAKLLVDSINIEALNELVEIGPKGEKALAKLERFLDAEGVPDGHALLSAFASVQGLRSRGAAHRKGQSFDIGVASGELGRSKGFEQLLGRAMQTLDTLSPWAANKPGLW